MRSKHSIPIGWQYNALLTAVMLLVINIIAWLPMALFKLGLTKSLVLGIPSYPLYVLWIGMVYLCGIGVVFIANFTPSIYFDEQGFEINTGSIIGENRILIPTEQISQIYLVNHTWLDFFVVQTTDGEEYVIGFVQCDIQTQQKLTDYFNHLFVQVTTVYPPKETLA